MAITHVLPIDSIVFRRFFKDCLLVRGVRCDLLCVLFVIPNVICMDRNGIYVVYFMIYFVVNKDTHMRDV